MHIKPSIIRKPKQSSLRRGLITDMAMLRRGDLNDRSGYTNPGDVVNAASWADFDHGSGIRTIAASSEYVSWPVPSSLTDWPCALVVVGEVITMSGTGASCWCVFNDSASQSFGMVLTDGKLQGIVYIGSYQTVEQSVATLSLGDTFVAVWNLEGFSARNLWLNGVQVGTHSTDRNFPTGGAGNFNIAIGSLLRASPTYDDSKISGVWLYDRALLPEEIMRISNDPWADYRQDDEVLWMGSAIGGGVNFNPAFAYNSNQVL